MSKRPLPASDAQVSDLLNISLIFYCKPRSFYFSMLRLRLTFFPLFFAIRTADFFCMLSLADYALSLIFVYRNLGNFFYLYAAFSGLRSFPYFYFLH